MVRVPLAACLPAFQVPSILTSDVPVKYLKQSNYAG